MEYSHSTGEQICAECVSDNDLKYWIDSSPLGSCSFCGEKQVGVVEFRKFLDRVEEVIGQHFGQAVDDLPYNSREGGYQGITFDTDYVLTYVGLDFPENCNGDDLRQRVLWHFESFEPWCEFDWTTLDDHQALVSSWEQFCDAIKHRRRFFFLRPANEESADEVDRDHVSFFELLSEIATLSELSGMIKEFPIGTLVYRARAFKSGVTPSTALELGPPPAAKALQSNRMNPPGVPMMYLSDTQSCAVKELGTVEKGHKVHTGTFKTTRPLRILDYSKLPPAPGYFSGAGRKKILLHRFLRHFVKEITRPVARDDRIHLDYLSSQVATEFLRDYDFLDGIIHGIRYPSTVAKKGTNLVLFGGPELVDPSPAKWKRKPEKILELIAIDSPI